MFEKEYENEEEAREEKPDFGDFVDEVQNRFDPLGVSSLLFPPSAGDAAGTVGKILRKHLGSDGFHEEAKECDVHQECCVKGCDPSELGPEEC